MKKSNAVSPGEKKTSGLKSYISIFWEFFKIGIMAVGGGTALIPQVQQIFVDEKKWLSMEESIDCITVSSALPGVIAVNLATHIGMRRNGVLGAVFATLGIITPSFLIIMIAVLALDEIGKNTYIQGAFMGIKASVCALILVSAIRIGRDILRGPFQWILMLGAFAAVGIFGISAVWIVMSAIVLGIAYNLFQLRRKCVNEASGEAKR